MLKTVNDIIASLKELSLTLDLDGNLVDSKYLDLQIIELKKVADELKKRRLR
jgi:hypothetical protein